MNTDCGYADVTFSFFYDELVYIKYSGFSKKRIESKTCMKEILSKKEVHGDSVSKQVINNKDNIHYDIIFSDSSVEDKMDRWIGKWS
ncbi:hypothetical protein GJV78_17715 [Escherichia alba]|jgi:hypothetical protein|uniref:Uncharacterized protein n=1 Tax=Intestinirhabdus alba TaxID=2899544 RepID=A0A6L6IQT2_9ENTR|nr:hypothetical protein [Intestinirhabdus alba]MTH48068.1 hypothetical protein [Intestinirhabdus alba]